jgi:hypothetical protein
MEFKQTDPTSKELRKIFVDNQLEFFIKEENKGILKVHFIVNTDEKDN